MRRLAQPSSAQLHKAISFITRPSSHPALRAPGEQDYILPPMMKRKQAIASISTPTDIAPTATPSVRKRASAVPLPQNVVAPAPPHRAPSSRLAAKAPTIANPNENPEVIDSIGAYRASPDADDDDDVNAAIAPSDAKVESSADARAVGQGAAVDGLESELSDVPDDVDGAQAIEPPVKRHKADGPKHVKKGKGQGKNNNKDRDADRVEGDIVARSEDNVTSAAKTSKVKVKVEESVGVAIDPEAEGPGDGEEDEEEVKQALSRPPPVNSEVLPLPWKGRLGYACLNTYLRNSNPPVFSSRTCRIASILEHRHPLRDPSQPEHATKNRPDREQPADVSRGQKYVEELGLANARDIVKMLRWNDKYGIKFMRLSSEMFPFASHDEYGYKLEPFAKEVLSEAGKVVAELGHRVTTHPGQFTQLGSPRKQVIDASIRDLEYHAEMLSLLNLPPQQDRDAVMILHLGGVFGDKEATIERFKENYKKLPQNIKDRLVLENDDVSWSVHDLLPICQELNIPLVLDYHHHNIIFDAEKLREGTKDICDLYPVILETWRRKKITPKMHYSEPCPDAITGRQRRKHSPRVATMPPCPNDMDLMIEAKDKEQAVFELMRTFKLPGFNTFNDIIPHVRNDDNRPLPRGAAKKSAKKGKKAKKDLDDAVDEAAEELEEKGPTTVPEEEVGMGGPENRVYWPPGMEEWLRPKKREVKKKEEGEGKAKATPKKKKGAKAEAETDNTVDAVPNGVEEVKAPAKKTPKKAAGTGSAAKRKLPKAVPTPETSDESEEVTAPSDVGEEEEVTSAKRGRNPPAALNKRRSGRGSQKVSYAEDLMSE